MRNVVHCLALAMVALGMAFTAQAQTYTYSMLYGFKNNGTDPQNADAALIVDSAGNLYGTSFSGGGGNGGTVFKVSKSGKLTVLHTFQWGPGDGSNPSASLTRDSAGNLYGTTKYGGNLGYGVVFKLSPSNQESILFSGFDGNIGVNGSAPNSVVRDSAGNLYGTTEGGGVYQEGIAFKIDTNNNFTILHNFCSTGYPMCPDGGDPQGLITTGGNFYGTTRLWGVIERGTVYQMTPDGVITVLHSFAGTFVDGDGEYPNNLLRQDAKANLYGVTVDGGVNNEGTLFKQPESGGSETVLYNFGSLPNCADGCYPLGPIALDKSGNIFGIAFTSTPYNHALVWEVNAAGQETVLHTFAANVSVAAGLIIDAAGNLYGVTASGGPANLGGVYKLTLKK